MESWEMGRLHRTRAVEAGQDSERHLTRNLWHRAREYGAPSEDSQRPGLGGKLLAKHEKGQEQRIPQSPVVLSHGSGQRMDSACYTIIAARIAHSFQDWHIDFAGSSVYYHILHGSKVCNSVDLYETSLFTVA